MAATVFQIFLFHLIFTRDEAWGFCVNSINSGRGPCAVHGARFAQIEGTWRSFLGYINPNIREFGGGLVVLELLAADRGAPEPILFRRDTR